jgi:hypothetical protein
MTTMAMKEVRGEFDVTSKPEPPYFTGEGITLARVHIDKVFRGPLEATSSLEMLSAMTGVKGSAGYVAVERIVGTLEGRAGSFVVQHTGTMTRGAPSLTITVVPDSGTGDLAGISGTIAVEIIDGRHFYVLRYAIASVFDK